MKRILALVLALILVFALASTAFAATDDSVGTFIPDPNNPGTLIPAPNNPTPNDPDSSFNPAPSN